MSWESSAHAPQWKSLYIHATKQVLVLESHPRRTVPLRGSKGNFRKVAAGDSVELRVQMGVCVGVSVSLSK